MSITLKVPLTRGECVEVERDQITPASPLRYTIVLRRRTKKWDKMIREEVVTDESFSVVLNHEEITTLISGMDKIT